MPDAKCLLLVDDDHDIARAAACRLRASGYRVLVAHDGATGLQSAILHRPDAIILDVRMPRMDGMQLLHELQHNELTRAIPVIVLSASLLSQHRALELGARCFLEKPYEPGVLLAALRCVLAEDRPGTGAAQEPGGPTRCTSGTPREMC